MELENAPLKPYKILYNPLEKALKNELLDSGCIKNNAAIFYWEKDRLEVYK